MKLTILLSHPVQYFAPLFKKLAEHPDLDVTVYYGSMTGVQRAAVDEQFGVPVQWDIPLLEGYRAVFLKNTARRPHLGTYFWGVQNRDLRRQLRRDRPDALIVHGWAYCSYVQGMFAARTLGIPVWLRTETPWNQEQMKKGLASRIKQHLTKLLFVRTASRCLFVGKQNRRYYENSGVPHHRLFYTPYCVDNERFRRTATELSPQRDALRQALGISATDTVFIFVGKLMSKKMPHDLLNAYAKVATAHTHLLFVGDGELRSELESEVLRQGLPGVQFVGFKNQSEVGEYYTVGDVFVLPSGNGETWGLVANEAMNFRLPLLVSDRVGCAADLVEEGGNGFTYPVGSVDELANQMHRLQRDPELGQRMGERSSEIIRDYSYERVLEGILAAAGLS